MRRCASPTRHPGFARSLPALAQEICKKRVHRETHYLPYGCWPETLAEFATKALHCSAFVACDGSLKCFCCMAFFLSCLRKGLGEGTDLPIRLERKAHAL